MPEVPYVVLVWWLQIEAQAKALFIRLSLSRIWFIQNYNVFISLKKKKKFIVFDFWLDKGFMTMIGSLYGARVESSTLYVHFNYLSRIHIYLNRSNALMH